MCTHRILQPSRSKNEFSYISRDECRGFLLYCLFPKCIKAVRYKLGASKHFLHRVMSWSVVQLALNFPSVSSAKHKLHFKSNVLFGRHVLI